MVYKFLLILVISQTIHSSKNEKNKYLDSQQNDRHVSRLKSPDFDEVSCELFEQDEHKVEKLKDAALINFVSSDPLPFNVSDLIQYKCSLNKKRKMKTSNMTNKSDNSSNGANIETHHGIDTATTVQTEKEAATKEARRANEYEFSSIEYYDDIPSFDESQCPDDVEVVRLEIDELRSYDLECEKIIEWRSLESVTGP